MAETTKNIRDGLRHDTERDLSEMAGEVHMTVRATELLCLLDDADALAVLEGDYDCPASCGDETPCDGCKASAEHEAKCYRCKELKTQLANLMHVSSARRDAKHLAEGRAKNAEYRLGAVEDRRDRFVREMRAMEPYTEDLKHPVYDAATVDALISTLLSAQPGKDHPDPIGVIRSHITMFRSDQRRALGIGAGRDAKRFREQAEALESVLEEMGVE